MINTTTYPTFQPFCTWNSCYGNVHIQCYTENFAHYCHAGMERNQITSFR